MQQKETELPEASVLALVWLTPSIGHNAANAYLFRGLFPRPYDTPLFCFVLSLPSFFASFVDLGPLLSFSLSFSFLAFWQPNNTH